MKFCPARLRLHQLEDRIVPSSPGDIDWLRQFGSLLGLQAPDPARAVVVAGGNVYVAGDELTGTGNTSLAFLRKYDAGGNELWTQRFGTSIGITIFAHGIAADATGIYVAGSTFGTLPGEPNAGGSDAFVRKYDFDGQELWTQQFGSAGLDVASGVTVDGTGVYVTGTTDGTFVGQPSAGGSDAFLSKFDAAGNQAWTRQFGTARRDLAYGVSADGAGIFVAGTVEGNPFLGEDPQNAFLSKFDPVGTQVWTEEFGAAASNGTTSSDGTFGVAAAGSDVFVVGFVGSPFPSNGPGLSFPGETSAGAADAFIRKYDGNGNEVWTDQFGSTAFDGSFGVAVDAGGVFVTGECRAALPGHTEIGDMDSFVRKYDVDGTEQWTHQFGGTGSTFARAVAVDDSGVYVVGSVIGALPGHTDFQGSGDSFARKYTLNGSEVWTDQFGPRVPQMDSARAVDADGNVYVAGQATGILPVQPEATWPGRFVRKFDASGNELWTHQFNTGSVFDQATAIVVDATGVYVAGFFSVPGFNSTPAFVFKLDADGNELWHDQFGASTDDSVLGIAADATGVYVTGSTIGVFPGETSAGGQDAFVRKYDAGGALLWTNQFGTSGADQATGVATDASGLYINGFTSGSFAGQTSAGGQDVFVRKYDTSGGLIWTSQFGTVSVDAATGVAAADGGVYVSGYTGGAFSGQSSGGDHDAFLRRIDTGSGAEVWTRQFGTPGADQATGVDVGPTGVYVAGFIAGTLPGETSAGGQDAFVRRYDFSGTPIWTTQFGTEATDSAAAVSVGQSGLFVAGTTNGTFAGQTSAGLNDAFVARLIDPAASNTPPSNLALALSASSITENNPATLTGSFADPDTSDSHVVVIDWGSSEETTTLNLDPGVTAFNAIHLYRDDNPTGTGTDLYPIRVTVADAGGSTSSSANLTVVNAAPEVTITGPASGMVVPVGTPVLFSGAFIDAGTFDTHTAQWTIGGVMIAGSVTQGAGSGTVGDSYTFTAPGVYSVMLTVTDDDGGTGAATTVAGMEALVVVYDPSAGFVTGGGWIDSPTGAYAANPTLTGRANFGFVSRYRHGANVPDGQTEFQFRAGDLNFHSTDYEWLVVSRARAQFKGRGTINGAGDYGFKLTAVDGQLPGGGGEDKFRIKIWDRTNGDAVVYDNLMGGSDGADPATVLRGGNIVIRSDNLLAEGVGPLGQSGGRSLRLAELRSLLPAARARWLAAGEDVSALRHLDLRVADLDGAALGLTAGGTIWIDRNAAGWGWFNDGMPRNDSEFMSPGNQGKQNRIDLLTVLLHELGHVLGHEHEEKGVMAETLAAGERRVPHADALSMAHASHSFILLDADKNRLKRASAWDILTGRREPDLCCSH